MVICKICDKEFKSSKGLGQHLGKTHNMNATKYTTEVILKNKKPLCSCGCGKEVTIFGFNIRKYIVFHAPEGKLKNGEFRPRDVEKWKKNLSISAKLFCKENPNHRKGKNNNFYGKKHTEETKQKIRNTILKQIKDGNHPFLGNINFRTFKSSIEKKFEKFLIKENIKYEHNFRIPYDTSNGIRYKYYDFKVYDELIELHGMYWHPKKIIKGLSEAQLGNYHNDIFKKKLAQDSGYKLTTVYEDELDGFIHNFYLIHAERKDVGKLQVEK